MFAALCLAADKPHAEEFPWIFEGASMLEAQPLPALTVPAEWGFTSLRLPAELPAKVVFLIQDIHADRTAQRNAAQIIEHLAETQRVGLVLSEGGSGDLSLGYFKERGAPDVLREYAGRYLDAGILSAPDYSSIVSERAIEVWGIEDEALYRANIEAFKTLEALRGPALDVLAAIEARGLARLRNEVNPDLFAALQAIRDYEEGALPLQGYFSRLIRAAQTAGVRTRDYAQLSLLERALQTRDAADAAMLQEAMDVAVLVRELGDWQRHVTAALAQTDAERRLLAGFEGLRKARNAIALRWTREDYAAFFGQTQGPDTTAWTLFAADVSDAAPLTERELSLVAEAYAAAGNFYRVAGERDAAMLERIQVRLERAPRMRAVLLAGGFHSAPLTKGLEALGYAVVVITPLGGSVDNHARYAQIIEFLHGPGLPIDGQTGLPQLPAHLEAALNGWINN